jgi:hypothetical protein
MWKPGSVRDSLPPGTKTKKKPQKKIKKKKNQTGAGSRSRGRSRQNRKRQKSMPKQGRSSKQKRVAKAKPGRRQKIESEVWANARPAAISDGTEGGRRLFQGQKPGSGAEASAKADKAAINKTEEGRRLSNVNNPRV